VLNDLEFARREAERLTELPPGNTRDQVSAHMASCVGNWRSWFSQYGHASHSLDSLGDLTSQYGSAVSTKVDLFPVEVRF
jgi:hypothetical protein